METVFKDRRCEHTDGTSRENRAKIEGKCGKSLGNKDTHNKGTQVEWIQLMQQGVSETKEKS